MQKSIFFSWQSQIKPNRNIIEQCLCKVVEELLNNDIQLEVVVDRDTSGSIGTIEIANTIFSKIDNSTIFVADISFIGIIENGRKVPNPNVLTELGYAANVLGWENIITLFNSNHGKVEELPFDIRHRRHIVFDALPNSDNSKSKKILIKDLTSAINPIIEKETIKESILNHFKLKIDGIIFKICSAIYYLLYGYKKTFFLDELFSLLTIEQITINSRLNQYLFGFSLFKEFSIYREQIENAYENPKYSKFLTNKQILNFIEISHYLENLERFLRNDISRSIKTDARNYKLNKVKSKSFTFFHRIHLVGVKDSDNNFKDAGFFRSYDKDFLLSYYKLGGGSSYLASKHIFDLLKNIDAVITSLGNNILVDPSKVGEP